MQLGLGSPRIEGWAWPKFDFQAEAFKDYTRFLRYPGPEQGLGYRVVRAGVITALRVRGLCGKPSGR